MNYIKLKKQKPNHKDLVLCKTKDGLTIPAIYYDNQSFKGFYPFTTHYHNTTTNYYSKVNLDKRFKKIVEWMPIPE